MSLASVSNIAGSGMSVQSTRPNIVASNIVSVETVSSSIDRAYRVYHPVFSTIFQQAQGDSDSLFANQDSPGTGMQVPGIVEDQSSLMSRCEPNHPAADANSCMYCPNVNIVEETADMISVSRVLQTSAGMINTAGQMMQKIPTLSQ